MEASSTLPRARARSTSSCEASGVNDRWTRSRRGTLRQSGRRSLRPGTARPALDVFP
jgi:hypothetical protein